ncbi:MAG: four helix bundle protein [Phycisphaerales bacterium]|nr:four helix bundle protein [Phycisphaerales bacterium]
MLFPCRSTESCSPVGRRKSGRSDGRLTNVDRNNLVNIVRGSVQECVSLLEMAKRRGCLDAGRQADLHVALEEIAKMLFGFSKAWIGWPG